MILKKEKKRVCVWQRQRDVTVVTQAYVEPSHGGEAPRGQWEQAHRTKIKQRL